MTYEFVDVYWYNLVGIVKVRCSVTEAEKFYIGVGKGIDVEEDIQYIKDWGQKFNPHMKFFNKKDVVLEGLIDFVKKVNSGNKKEKKNGRRQKESGNKRESEAVYQVS